MMASREHNYLVVQIRVEQTFVSVRPHVHSSFDSLPRWESDLDLMLARILSDVVNAMNQCFV